MVGIWEWRRKTCQAGHIAYLMSLDKPGCLGNGEFQTIRGFIVNRQMGLSENVLGLPNHLL